MMGAEKWKVASKKRLAIDRRRKDLTIVSDRREKIYGFGESNQLFLERRQQASQSVGWPARQTDRQNIPHRTMSKRIPR